MLNFGLESAIEISRHSNSNGVCPIIRTFYKPRRHYPCDWQINHLNYWIVWRTFDLSGFSNSEKRRSRRFRANISCRIFCDKARTQAQLLDISAGGARVRIANSVLADLPDESWKIELPGVATFPIKLRWQVAPDHGIAFNLDQNQADKLVDWLTTSFAEIE